MTFGRHVLNRLRVDKHGSGFLFSLTVFEEKSPYRVGRHVLNVFYLKDFVTWQVCEMFSDVSLGGVFYVAFATTTLWRHVLNRLRVDKHGSGFLFSLTVFEEKSPYRVGRHVLNVWPKKGVNLSTEG